MASAFDPYHLWLSIPPDEQPPHHYRLLGIELFEHDLDVIEIAANRQTAFLRTVQVGEHAEQCRKLIDAIENARICLLNAKKKSIYDARLRTQIGDRESQIIKEANAASPIGEEGDATDLPPPPIQEESAKRVSAQKDPIAVRKVKSSSRRAVHPRETADTVSTDDSGRPASHRRPKQQDAATEMQTDVVESPTNEPIEVLTEKAFDLPNASEQTGAGEVENEFAEFDTETSPATNVRVASKAGDPPLLMDTRFLLGYGITLILGTAIAFLMIFLFGDLWPR